jgi:hypothetical protein
MALVWSWGFGNEGQTQLETAGFVFTNGSNGVGASLAASSTDVYTYAGSPTRYSLTADVDNAGEAPFYRIAMPGEAITKVGSSGIFTMAYRTANNTDWDQTFVKRLMSIETAINSNAVFIETDPTGTVSLYVDNAFKGTSGGRDTSDWGFYALVFDVSTTTFTGSIYVNGVLQVTGSDTTSSTSPGNIVLAASQSTQTGVGVFGTVWGQFILYDDPVADLADAVSPDNFVTRIVPNANSAGTIGAWTPTGAANNWQAVNPPIDTTTFSGIAVPAPLDRLEVETANATNLQTLLGINPSSIKGATVHNISVGTAATAKIGVQEGGSETLGAAFPVSPVTDTYAAETVLNNPSTGTAWVGADQPILVYEVDSV